MTLVFRNTAMALVTMIKQLQGRPAGEALAAICTALPVIVRDLEGVCGSAAKELVRLQGFLTQQAQFSPDDIEAVNTVVEQVWSIIAGLNGDREKYDDLIKDTEARRKKAKSQKANQLAPQRQPLVFGAKSPQGGKAGTPGAVTADSEQASRAHVALVLAGYNQGVKGCWACHARGVTGSAQSGHLIRTCRSLGAYFEHAKKS